MAGGAGGQAGLDVAAGRDADAWPYGWPLFCGIGKSGALKGQLMAADPVVARLLKQAGLDPTRFSAHSLGPGPVDRCRRSPGTSARRDAAIAPR
jgi:hypothetical protein